MALGAGLIAALILVVFALFGEQLRGFVYNGLDRLDLAAVGPRPRDADRAGRAGGAVRDRRAAGEL